MSHNANATGFGFAAGYFLKDDEGCVRDTMTIASNHAQKVTRNGRTIVPMGAVIPANNSTATGILYEDVDVTDGAHEGSVVTAGCIFGDRLPAALSSSASIPAIKVYSSPTVTRPYTSTVS